MGLHSTELNFELIELIGDKEGKNSTVYKAYDPQLDATLVVKKVPKQQILKDCPNIDKSVFFIESKMLYSTKHPNIMEIQYACQDKESIYFSMPYCKNGSLNTVLNQRYLTVKEIIKYSLEFLSGIHYIHTKNLIHFDIKPTNILINNNGKAIVTDFGLAKYTDLYGLAKPNKIYISHTPPEAYMYSDFTNRSDIYQAGVTLYRMCNGNRNYKEQYQDWLQKDNLKEAIIKGWFPDRKWYLPHIPNKLRRIINKAMSTKVDKRYETVLDMINAISDIEENLNWVFDINERDNYMMWEIMNTKETHIDRIEVRPNKDKLDIIGTKVRLIDGYATKVNKNTKKGNSNIEEVLKYIENVIKRY